MSLESWRAWWWLTLWACAGCGSAGLSPGTGAGTLVRRVAGPGTAERYETQVPSGTGLLDDARQTLAAVVSGASGSGVLRPDPRLAELARWVGQWTELDGAAPGQSALDDAARQLGLVEPTPHILVIGANDAVGAGARLQRDLEGLLGQHAYTHFGGAVVPRGTVDVFVLCLAFRFVDLQPVPRKVAAGSTITLEGALPSGYREAAWALTLPDGRVERGEPAHQPKFRFQLATQDSGIYRVELLAQSELGVVVIANFPVYVGQEPAPDVAIYAPQNKGRESAADAAQHLFTSINTERAAAHLTPLEPDARLKQVAEAHNADMLAHNFIGHTSKTTGDASDRVARAGVRTGLVLENIGRGYSAAEVHSGLMQSPGHRGNLLSPLATHVGIAVNVQPEEGHDAYLVTEVFMRVTPKLEGNAAEQLLTAVNHERTQHSRSQLQETSKLTELARKAVAHCFDKNGETAVMNALRSALPAGIRVSVVLSLASSLQELSQVQALLEPARAVGIAVVQGERPDTAPGSICALVLMSD
jgi:uncharacterized protein YkwD